MELCAFIEERERHRLAHDGDKPFRNGRIPDPIISKYRFCNVRRNDDRVSKYVLGDFLPRYDRFVWFAAMVARLFNKPETLAEIAPHVIPFNAKQVRKILHARKSSGVTVFNGAYIVSTNGHTGDKIDYLIDHVLSPAWGVRLVISRKLEGCATLAEAHTLLCSLNGLASFMAAQVLGDVKYRGPPGRWDDFHTFAASGPGSRRGLNRVMGHPLTAPWKEFTFREVIAILRDRVNARLKMEPLTGQDLQNCLCEFDKYERARLGEGTPKQLYTPHKENKS